VNTAARRQGFVVELWRYPVKSMQGEEIEASEVTERGLLGDRVYALVDLETDRIVSARNPQKWPDMFDFRAELVRPPRRGEPIPPARITFPSGENARTDEANVDKRISAELGGRVRLASSVPSESQIEGYWPDYIWLPRPDEFYDLNLLPGTFFDGGAVHLLTTASLESLRLANPQSRFDVPRFRPNIVVEPADESAGFVENAWVGQVITIGEEVQLRITGTCASSVTAMLAQGDLPNDPDVLKTILEQNSGDAGVLAIVVHGGRIRRGDAVGVT
jgi:MOSC domain-containing protein